MMTWRTSNNKVYESGPYLVEKRRLGMWSAKICGCGEDKLLGETNNLASAQWLCAKWDLRVWNIKYKLDRMQATGR